MPQEKDPFAQYGGAVNVPSSPATTKPSDDPFAAYGGAVSQGSQSIGEMDTKTLADLIQQHEGYAPGSRSDRNNNPGNMKVQGDLGQDEGFGKFSTYEKGRAALEDQVASFQQRYPHWTTTNLAARWLGSVSGDPSQVNPREGDVQAYAAALTTSARDSDPFAAYGGAVNTTKPRGPAIPKEVRKTDPQAPWYSRLWDAANTPLTTTLFGWGSHREGATGWEKGLEDFASGFSSPLSVGLLIGTLGSSAAFEATGSVALRAAGMGAAEIAEAQKGTQVIASAIKAGRNSAEALQAAGVSPSVMSKAVTVLKAAGLSSESMTTHGLFGGGLSSGLRAMGVGLGKADAVGKGIQMAVDMGFKAQGAYQAVQESPRLLDALKDGDYETAKELFIHVLGGGAQAAIGGRKFLKDAGSTFDDVGEKFGFKVKMTNENQKLRDNYGIYQGDKTQAQQAGKILTDDLREKYDKLTPTDRQAVFYLIQANSSPEVISKRLNMLADAAGRPQDKVTELPDPVAGPEQLGVMKVFHGTSADGPLSVTKLDGTKYSKARGGGGMATYVSTDPKVAADYVANNEGAKVIAGILHPNIHLLDAREPLPQDINSTLSKAFTNLAKQHAPGADPAALFREYNAETQRRQGTPTPAKNLGDPNLTYVEMIDAARQMLENKGDANFVRKGLLQFQKALGDEGYDGIQNLYKDRPVIGLFPEEVTGRSMEEILKPATPTKQLTADEAKVWNTDAEAAEIDRQLRYHELVARQDLKKSPAYKPQELDELFAAYKRAHEVAGGSTTDPRHVDMRLLAQDLGKNFAASLENAQKNGVIKRGIQDYVTQIWAKDQNHPAANRLIHDADNGMFQENVSMARHRMFDSAFEGQLLGKKLAVTDPITLVGNHIAKVGSAIAARKFMERLMDGNLRGSDGRPATALAGHGQLIEGPEGENPAVNVDPDRIRNIRIADDVIKGLKKTGDLDRFIEEGRIIKYWGDDQARYTGDQLKEMFKLPPGQNVRDLVSQDKVRFDPSTQKFAVNSGDPHYLWNTHDYQTIDHSAFHDWNFAARAQDGTKVMVRSELRVHPEFYDYLKRLIGDEGKRNALVEAGLKVGGEAKHLTLSLSPFHLFQEGLRALMTGVSPFGIEKWDTRTDPVLRRLTDHGLTLGKDHASIQDYAEGNIASGKSWVISKLPIVRDIQNWMQNLLFERYIPGLKVRASKMLLKGYEKAARDANGNYKEGWDADRVARTAAEDTNERFGGINYKQLGRSAGAQDFLRLAALAPDWLESELRFTQRVFTAGPEGSVARRDFVRMTAGLWVVARVLNYLTSGKPHNEAPFGVALQDKEGHEKVYSIRTMPTDMLHMMHDPVDFLRGRESPLLKLGDEAMTGRDRMGRKLTPYQTFVDVTRQNLPIPVQLAGQAMTGELPASLTNKDQAVKAAGLTVMPYRTEAEKLAIQLASNRTPSGAVDPAQLRRHQVKMRFEDQLRSGELQPTDIHNLVEGGDLAVKEGKEIIKNARETHGMDAETAGLYSRAIHLPMKDFLQVWDAATADEKAALSKLLLKKKQAFFKTAHRNMAPEERKNDPTYRRLRSMFPSEAPW